MSLDLSGYLDVFADEAREHLQNLNQALLEFEKNPDDSEQVNVMFRSAHTLKGMSATMGFTEVAELTHKMENLLSPVRDGKLPVDEELVDLLFQCLDALQEMAEAHISGEEPTTDIQDLVNHLVAKMSGGKAETAAAATAQAAAAGPGQPASYPGEITPEIAEAISSAVNNGKEVFHLHVELEKTCEMQNVRAFMVLGDIQKISTVISSQPDEKTLTEGELEHQFHMLVSTDIAAEELISAASTTLEVELATALPFDPHAAPVAPATPADGLDARAIFTFNEYDITVLRQASGEGFKVVHVHAVLEKECALKSARAFMLHKQLEEVGEIVAIVPDVEDIDAEKFDRDLDFLVVTQEAAASISKRCEQISEVEKVLVNAECQIPSQPSTPGQFKADASPAKAATASESTAGEAKLAKAPAGKPEETKKAEHKVAAKQTQTIRVDTERLDMLLNLVGELVIGKTRLQSLAKEVQRRELSDTIEHFDQIVFDLQNVVMQTRMVPIETVFNRFPRMIRDLAKSCGKQIDLQMEGGETELDRTVVDEIGDPLVHLIRNAIDHGIEIPDDRAQAGKGAEGLLMLSAFHEGSNVFIQIKDDGKGIDPAVIRRKVVEKGMMSQEQANALSDQEAVEQVFAPGFSTVEKVTDVSGRGVGMDVVRSKIEQLSGNVRVMSKLGEGSTFTIKLPLTLAIVQALLIKANEEDYAIPLAYIEETLRIWPKDIKKVNKADVHVLRGDVLPLVYLRDLMHSPECERESESWFVVVVRSGKDRIGLCVDQPVGQMEIVIKSLGRYLQNVKFVAGGTILGDGTVALILDIAHIAG